MRKFQAYRAEIVAAWTMAPVVAACQAMRGIGFITAVTLAAAAGDVRRFEHPCRLMALLGLGHGRHRGGITKTGNARARMGPAGRARTYHHRREIGEADQRRQTKLLERVRDIGWKAQAWQRARYRRLFGRGKRATATVTAGAKELAAFLWDIAQHAELITQPVQNHRSEAFTATCPDARHLPSDRSCMAGEGGHGGAFLA